MTRADARTTQTVSIKQTTNSNQSLRRFLTIISIAVVMYIIYFIFRTPEDYLGDSSDAFIVKTIPKVYTSAEGIDPEENDVFHGFRTSFLPEEEIVLARRKREEGNSEVKSNDGIAWCDTMEKESPKRVKRTDAHTFNDYEYEHNDNQEQNDDSNESISNGSSEGSETEEEDLQSNSKEYTDDVSLERLESVVQPHTHVDRGPFDDVVEQVRGQPELEEEELGTSAHLFKPSKSYSGIHAFWKGQGDRETIRKTQAHIMKQYMDEEADPCQDFYQYACGNWPTLNPIPADKAGYDTFEMLRENLDSVLKDLLEFKHYESIHSTYPGANLDVKDDLLMNIAKKKTMKTKFSLKNFLKPKSGLSSEQFNLTSELDQTLYEKNNDKTAAVGRIKRYLDKKIKSKRTYKTESKVKEPSTEHPKENAQRNPKTLKIIKRNVDKEVRSIFLPEEQTTTEKVNNSIIETRLFHKQVQKNHVDDPAHGNAALKARYLFKSCMNYEILQKRGHQPLLDLLNLLGGWPILDAHWEGKKFDWLELMAKLRLFNNDILISEWVGPDIKNSDEFVIQFDQTSLGLPTREYFLQDANKQYLEAYKEYLTKIATLLGGNPEHVKKSAEKLIGFEIKLAKITSAPEDRKNVSELYRRMPLHKLEELVPQVKWKRYLCIVMNRHVHSKETVVLFALSYVRHLVQLIHETESSVLANYLLWRFVRHRVNNLDDRFQSAKQQFYFILFGREQAPPRWKNCIAQVNSNMGMALGSMFVKKYFDEISKNDTLTMTREIQRSFKELLHMTDWIDDKTKDVAAHKVDAMMLRIGYPDFILTTEELDNRYKEVIIHPDKYFENILNILQHLTKMEQSRIGQPVNKTLWNTAPAVVNAYYSRNKNQIMFPAGILQPPFYHRHFPRSLNYGGIGVVIGHEITHGFDDKGRLFDCDGNLHRWWSDSAIEAFHRRAQCLIDQYGRYIVPEVNMKLDGINTQGENIADNGGVKQAFRAYLRWLRQNGSAAGETLPGLNHTHTQLFFLNFAQVWCGAMRPEATRNKLKTAVHSPGRFRVVGTLSNSNDFAREFSCKPGTPMNPVHKCSVW